MQESLIEQMADVLECDPSEITPDTVFRDHPHWSSLALLSAMAMIDETFQVLIPRDDFDSLVTVGDLAAYIEAAPR
jgi:acyl carrier protein